VRAFEHLEHANASEEWKLNAMKEDSYPFIKTRMKRRSILFGLPYWKVLGSCHFIIQILVFEKGNYG